MRKICERQMAGAIEMSRRWRVITTPSANANIITTESTRPSPCAPPGPPTMRPTPTRATAMATTVRREIDSRSATQAISAAAIGDAACMKRTLATVVWLSATMKQPEARAVRAATASEARPHRREGGNDVPTFHGRDEDQEREGGEDRATRDLGGPC